MNYRAIGAFFRLALPGLCLVQAVSAAAPESVDFVRDVQPILVDNCHRCHGPEKQKGDLRLDAKEVVFTGGLSGPAVTAGDSENSLIMQHVLGLDGFKRMPPGAGNELSENDIATLRAWIDQGAAWPDDVSAELHDPRTDHWSYQSPKRTEPPTVQHADRVRNPIDQFILSRLEREELEPSPEADRATLLRRLSIDLIGLPPTPAEVEAFLADASEDAYENAVDRLLASPRFGEHWGRYWLDAARYADTNGYEKDRPRVMWRYRDWVINALNEDMPFDQFTIEQLAGDMLPDPTPEQMIATGFHRNTMFNEEGGIDVEEFRFHAVVDRVGTTGTVWLGSTLACAQCHNHKYDPVSQRDYYQFFALLNNADEPMLDVPTEQERAVKAEVDAKVAGLQSRLESQYPLPDDRLTWTLLDPVEMSSANGTTFEKQADRSILAGGPRPDKDTYTVKFNTRLAKVVAVKIEAMTDTTLPRTGPGRADNGNFVLSELRVDAGPKDKPDESQSVPITNAWADGWQPKFSILDAIDGNASTGWAVDPGADAPMHPRSAVFEFKEPFNIDGDATLVVNLEQQRGGRHLLGRFRVWVATLSDDSIDQLREQHVAADLAAWEVGARRNARDWRVMQPVEHASERGSTLEVMGDQSILVFGDSPTRDTYTVEYDTDLPYITGLRLEAIADERLPFHGPGRGSGISDGGFMLSELTAVALPPDGNESEAVALKFKHATADYHGSFGGNEHPPQAAIDGNRDSGWSITGGIGRDHVAVFELAEPVRLSVGTRIRVTLLQNFIDQQTLGRFRFSATADAAPIVYSSLPIDVEAALAMPAEWCNDADRATIRRHFITSVASDLKARHEVIDAVRDSAPTFTTTLVMQERIKDPRQTHMHIRGEFNNLGQPVEPDVPEVLPPLPEGQTADRLALAKWLVSEENPLTARVFVNRLWLRLFGRGIVETTEDFGLQASPPTHPELLDWLALRFMDNGWRIKATIKNIVMSGAYRQSSRVTPELLEKDPYNKLLARGPRLRMDAEVVRDFALAVGGLLSDKMGGPSVFPPQPDGVTANSFGALKWEVSPGEDRYRRGVYTFWKRTTPFAGMVTFDAPSRETCVVSRVRSNTPLQALTLMNDPVYVEASEALAKRLLREAPNGLTDRINLAFKLCLSREPTQDEFSRLTEFYEVCRERFANPDQPRVVKVADQQGTPPELDPVEVSTWTLIANLMLNLDETITKG